MWGVSSPTLDQLINILDSGGCPSVVQVECHPYLQRRDMLDLCRLHKIQMHALQPLGGAHKSRLLDDPILWEFSVKQGITVAQIVLLWNKQRGVKVIGDIPPDERLPGVIMAYISTLNYRNRVDAPSPHVAAPPFDPLSMLTNEMALTGQSGGHEVTGQSGGHEVTRRSGGHEVTRRSGGHEVTRRSGGHEVTRR
jgi:hypothetical protein